MTPLAQFIAAQPHNADILALLDQDVEQAHNHELWTYGGVASIFGPEVAEGLAQAMTAAGLTTAVIVYAAKGFDLSLDATRLQLDAIAVGVPQLAPACEALKQIGRPTVKRHTLVGIANLPTTEEIAAASDEVVEAKLIAGVTSQYQAINTLASQLTATAINEVLTTAATLDAAKPLLDKSAIDDLITQLNSLKAAIS